VSTPRLAREGINRRGFTLIEVLVGMVLGAIVMTGVVQMLIVQGRVPSYLGTSAAFVGGVAAIRAQGGDSADVTGAILIAGAVLAVIGVLIHFLGSGVLHRVLPPVLSGLTSMITPRSAPAVSV